MTKTEFAEVLAYLELAIGKPIHDEPAQALARSKLYLQALGDLSLDVLRAAAEQVVAQRKYPTFPQIGELREISVAIRDRRNNIPDAGEAWMMAMATALEMRVGLDFVNGVPLAKWNNDCLAELPDAVAVALQRFGFERIQDTPNDQLGTAFAQFRSIYEALAVRVKSDRLLPAPLKARIDGIGAETVAAIAKIGAMPE